MRKINASLLAISMLTGCADGNIHQFINSDYLNATAPSVASLGKMFYPDRYSPFLHDTVPSAFANTAPDHIGNWDFVGFTGSSKDNLYMANYVDPRFVSLPNSMRSFKSFVFYSNTRYTRSKRPFLSIVIVYNLDCQHRMIKMHNLSAYSSTRPVGNPVSTLDISKKNKLIGIENDPLAERFFDKICT